MDGEQGCTVSSLIFYFIHAPPKLHSESAKKTWMVEERQTPDPKGKEKVIQKVEQNGKRNKENKRHAISFLTDKL